MIASAKIVTVEAAKGKVTATTPLSATAVTLTAVLPKWVAVRQVETTRPTIDETKVAGEPASSPDTDAAAKTLTVTTLPRR